MNDLGLSAHDVAAFRGPAIEGQEMDYSHMSPPRMAALHAHSKGKHSIDNDHPHDDYPQFCAFSRRMKHGVHCMVLSTTGVPKNTALMMLPENDGIEFQHSHIRTQLKFADLERVTDLGPGKDLCPHQALVSPRATSYKYDGADDDPDDDNLQWCSFVLFVDRLGGGLEGGVAPTNVNCVFFYYFAPGRTSLTLRTACVLAVPVAGGGAAPPVAPTHPPRTARSGKVTRRSR